MKALVVDDSRVARLIVGNCLRELGIEVVEADSGKRALDALVLAGNVELMFLDWNMPGISGMECLRRMRRDARWKGVRVCMVTCEAEIETIVTALEEGADEYLMKPFTREALQDKIQFLTGVVNE